ncbi:MAG: tetratricopeptide repeat domain-containing [Lasallia pustulata]|uniref:ER membrane protein complex subunit 2 n=1 Tax=Lasallia pustulata TaxID=136370 RepID=A0A5M8Q166_9LECA|nr:MAG: tetratricopeptide repeat domain-containing [Lasallia pustulata]
MSTMQLTSPMRQSHASTLHLSQQAPQHLQKHPAAISAIPVPLLSNAESTELWAKYEQLFLSCLRTGDDKSAHLCLERLIDRFGATNERVMGLRGLYQEAVAEDDTALEKVLQGYEDTLAADPTNTPILKRRVALLRSLSRPADAIAALVELLDASPTDIEAWTELADLYLTQKMIPQAVFCLEEVLLVAPNAWNIHARLGEVLYISLAAPGAGTERTQDKVLVEAVRRFCRSIELCEGYLRGYYGLKMATDRFLAETSRGPAPSAALTTHSGSVGELPTLSRAAAEKLNERATSMIVDIVRRRTTGNGNSGPHQDPEVIAARELLDRTAQSRSR